MAVTIDTRDWASKARLRCPRGHTWWYPHEDSFYCGSCNAIYEQLEDRKTREWVSRADVEVR